MTLGVRCIVYNEAERSVFLVRHTYVPGWHLPGGGVETGETLFEALAHELAEEGNIEMTGPPSLVAVYHNSLVSRRDHVALFLVTGFRQSAPKASDREIAEAGFFPVDRLPAGTTRATREAVAGRTRPLGGALREPPARPSLVVAQAALANLSRSCGAA